MDNEQCERQTPIEFRCKKILASVEKMDNPSPVAADITEIGHKEGPEKIIASPTPQKPEWKRRSGGTYVIEGNLGKQLEDVRCKDVTVQSEGVLPVSESSNSSLKGQIELPDKYKTLADLFNRMESSIRLLALRNKLPIFHNICTQVEILSRMKFLPSHLAQMKSVFPEAIHIEKILVHDAKSLCMKPEMKITLVLDAVESPLDPDQSASMVLHEAFSAKLLELYCTSPKGADIPEAVLPEPFNRRNDIVLENASLEGSLVEVPLQASLDSVLKSRASHFPSSFCTQFSQKVIVPERQLTQLLAPPPSLVSIGAHNEGKESSKSSLTKENICSVSAVKSPNEAIRHRQSSQKVINPETELTQPLAPPPSLVSVGADNVGSELSKCLTTEKLRSVSAVKLPDKAIRHHTTSQFLECTPVKSESSAAELMLGTPVLQTPHRPIPTPHEKLVSEKSSPGPMSTSSARRSLKLIASPETDGSVSDLVTCTTEQNKATAYSSQHTVTTQRGVLGEEFCGSSANQLLVEGVGAVSEVENHKLSQVARGMRQEFACLPNMFDTICHISQSFGYSSITKQELVHKIILNNLETEDRREVEEQLTLLEELAPDWICKKTVSTGDFLYCFKQTTDLESVRARLVKAV